MIFGLGPSPRFFLYSQPTDMRKGFDGLGGLVRNNLASDPMSGDVFIFMNRCRNLIKLLYWDQSGFVIFYKRLEKGTFQLPLRSKTQTSVIIPRDELLLILEGIELENVKKKARYFSRKIVN